MVFRKSLFSGKILGLLNQRIRIKSFREIIFLIVARIKRINSRIDI
jgi:hypothetical protein